MYKKPNFLIVGAAKSGTTSLANYLNEHPDLFIPKRKELRFFIKDILKSVNNSDPQIEGILNQSILEEIEYFKQFEVENKLAGEASVHYLYHHETVIPKVQKYLGDIPIIIILRNPIDRAVSNWQYVPSDNNSFQESLRLENNRKLDRYNSFWYYKDQGFYYKQVKNYIDNFSKVKVLFFEEFKNNTQNILNEVFDFLEISHITITNINKIYNKRDSISPKFILRNLKINYRYNFIIYKYLKLLKLENLLFNTKSKNLDYDFKYNLYLEYLPDIKNLEKLLNKDLSYWIPNVKSKTTLKEENE